MAEFSRQYVERHDPEIGGFDFDFDKEFSILHERMHEGKYHSGLTKSLICEGYGITGIGVSGDGEQWCEFPINNVDVWVPYKDIDKVMFEINIDKEHKTAQV